MGIPGYSRWVSEQFPQAFTQAPAGGFDHVYVDVNALIHPALRTSQRSRRWEASFFRTLYQRLDQILRICRPGRTLVLALDGAAPLAKIATQRSRRVHMLADDGQGVPSERAPASLESLAISQLALTPGTELMSQIEAGLEFYAASRLLTRTHKFAHCVVSPATVTGEGELKIQDMMIEVGEGTHALVGNDADLILLAASAMIDGVHVVTNSIDPNDYRFLSADLLADQLGKLRPGRDSPQLEFATISLLAGNDYLPKLRTVQFSQVWQVYASRKSISPLLCPDDGLGPGFFELMDAMACGQPSPPRDERQCYAPVELYLQGLLWNLAMYLNGQCPDVRFCLDRHLYAPSPREIADWYAQQDGKSIRERLAVPSSDQPGLSVPECLLALLPRAATALLPGPMQPLVQSAELAGLYKAEQCDKCAWYRNELRSLQQAIFVKKKLIAEQAASKDFDAEDQEAVRALQKLKEKARDRTIKYGRHKAREHEEPLPWDALQHQVARMPMAQFSERELHRISDGTTKCFWNGRGANPPNKHLAQGGKLSQIKSLPKPPVGSWKALSPRTRLWGGEAPQVPRRSRAWARRFSCMPRGRGLALAVGSLGCTLGSL